MSTVEMPFKYNQGSTAESLGDFRTYGGTMAELNFTPLPDRSRTLGNPDRHRFYAGEHVAFGQIPVSYHRPVTLHRHDVFILFKQLCQFRLDHLVNHLPCATLYQIVQGQSDFR